MRSGTELSQFLRIFLPTLALFIRKETDLSQYSPGIITKL